MTGLTTERYSRGAKVQLFVVGVERDRLVARQVDALPYSNQMWNPIDQADLRSLQQHVRMKVKLVLCCCGAGKSHQSYYYQ
jgi:hypothetical protein